MLRTLDLADRLRRSQGRRVVVPHSLLAISYLPCSEFLAFLHLFSAELPQGNVRKHYMDQSRKDNPQRVYSAAVEFATIIPN